MRRRQLTKWVGDTLKEPGKAVFFEREDTVLIYMTRGSRYSNIYREPRGSIARLEACRGRSNVTTDVSRCCCVWMAGVRYVVVLIVCAVWSLHQPGGRNVDHPWSRSSLNKVFPRLHLLHLNAFLVRSSTLDPTPAPVPLPLRLPLPRPGLHQGKFG